MHYTESQNKTIKTRNVRIVHPNLYLNGVEPHMPCLALIFPAQESIHSIGDQPVGKLLSSVFKSWLLIANNIQNERWRRPESKKLFKLLLLFEIRWQPSFSFL